VVGRTANYYRWLCEVGRGGRGRDGVLIHIHVRVLLPHMSRQRHPSGPWEDVEGMHQFGKLAASRQEGEELQLAYLLSNSFMETNIS
jgi:hypothetical protein